MITDMAKFSTKSNIFNKSFKNINIIKLAKLS